MGILSYGYKGIKAIKAIKPTLPKILTFPYLNRYLEKNIIF